MVRDQMIAQVLERVGGRVGVMKQLEILFGNGAPLGHRLEIQHLIPVLAAVQHDADLLRQLVGLHQREDLEQLVERAEAARKDDERLR